MKWYYWLPVVGFIWWRRIADYGMTGHKEFMTWNWWWVYQIMPTVLLLLWPIMYFSN